ncbi:MAG: Mu transposase C-terminal domain-containing protein, partial [Rhodospirillales bacterium]|nr:Mu transposase C-terminal domain-containing protein [Rhodospirillales bacterium]
RKVGQNCHIRFDKNHYSAPEGYIGRQVEVRVGERMVSEFSRPTLSDRRDAAQFALMMPDSEAQGDSVREHGGHRHPGDRLCRACSSPPVALRSSV